MYFVCEFIIIQIVAQFVFQMIVCGVPQIFLICYNASSENNYNQNELNNDNHN